MKKIERHTLMTLYRTESDPPLLRDPSSSKLFRCAAVPANRPGLSRSAT
jgi:hypothetical protein